MKYWLLFLFVLLSGLKTGAQPRAFKVKPLSGFYLDDRIPLKKGLNFFVISNRKDFIRHFGLVNKPDTPNFQFYHVVVMAMPPTKSQYFLSFQEDGAKAGNYIEVYCDVRFEKHKITYYDHPIIVARVPKYFSVSKVNFYDNSSKKLLESVPIH